MGSFSIWHWLILLGIVVLVFGTKKLRNMGGDLGAAVRNFKDAMDKGENEGHEPTAKSETVENKLSAQTEPTGEQFEEKQSS